MHRLDLPSIAAGCGLSVETLSDRIDHARELGSNVPVKSNGIHYWISPDTADELLGELYLTDDNDDHSN